MGGLLVLYSSIRKKFKKSYGSRNLENCEILEITMSRNEEKTLDVQTSSLCAETMFASIHGLLREDAGLQEHLSFEVVSSGASGIKFYVVVPTDILKFVESQIYAQYPSVSIRVVDDYCKRVDPEHSDYEVAEVSLTKPYFFPIKTFRDFETDPLSAFTSALSQVKEDEEIWFQMVVQPIPDIWQKEGFNFVNSVREGQSPAMGSTFTKHVVNTMGQEVYKIFKEILTGGFLYKNLEASLAAAGKTMSASKIVKLSPTQELEISSIENKLAKVGFQAVIRIMSSSKDPVRLDNNMRSITAALKQYSTLSSNSFKYNVIPSRRYGLEAFCQRIFEDDKSVVLNGEELATIFHLPTTNIDTPNISWSYSRKSEPPSNLPTEKCVYIGDTIFRGKKVRFGLADNDDRTRHMYVIGKSGTGKSTLFIDMIIQDIKNGAGVCMLDPHGEVIDTILEFIPDNRLKDVVYFDPSDVDHPIGLNLLEVKDQSQKGLAASGLLAAIKHHFDYSWGPRLEYLLNYALLTLIEVPGTTMLGITRLMEDKNYRNYIIHKISDPVVKKFWEVEYKEMAGNQRFITEAISPIQNKVNRFLAPTTIRNILGQAKSTLDFEEVMNEGKILLINLSKGKIGADNANLLGALLVSRIQFFALQRAKEHPEDRKPFYLYVDEFQNFATGSFEEILSESRKYKLGLYLTHQFTGQLPETLLKAVLGNVGTIITFAAGAMDAKVMENEFVPYFEADDIVTLERFHVYVKLMIDGMTSLPFSVKILRYWDEDFMIKKTGNKEKAIEYSRQAYGTGREYVEAKIAKWMEMPFDKGMSIAEEHGGVNDERTTS